MAVRLALDEFMPPNNLEAEMCALGSMLLSERAVEEVISLLEDADFYSPAHQEIYSGIKQLRLEKKAIDIVTLKNILTERETLQTVGGVDYLIQVAESVPSAANATHYAQIVQDKATLRRLQDAGQKIIGIVREPESDAEVKVDHAEQLVFEVGRRRMGKYFTHVRSLARDFFVDVDTLLETGEPATGIPSGFSDLDKMTGGFYPSDMTIVAARPSMGKTSLVLSFALNVARQGRGNVAVFSLEMSGKQLVRRMVSMLSGVSMGVLRKSQLGTEEYERLADACETLYTLPIFVDDSSDIHGLEMRGKCRRLKEEGGLALVVVDYLQLMRSHKRSENRVQEISEIARSLKAMAKELDVPVIALSQLNRGVEARENKRPLLADIRESGSIEAEADLVMFIYRDAYYKAKEVALEEMLENPPNEVAELIISKHRNGPTGMVLMGFQPNIAKFGLLAEESKSGYMREHFRKE